MPPLAPEPGDAANHDVSLFAFECRAAAAVAPEAARPAAEALCFGAPPERSRWTPCAERHGRRGMPGTPARPRAALQRQILRVSIGAIGLT